MADRVFPAHAGMSLFLAPEAAARRGFPRSRGDEPIKAQSGDSLRLFSPLTRG